MTPFRRILEQVVEGTPNAIGGAFADADGEMVDSVAKIDPHEWAVLTAHYGVVLAQLTAMFGMWHYGGPEFFIAQHNKIEVIVLAVDAGYYALVAAKTPADLDISLDQLRVAATALRKEMA